MKLLVVGGSSFIGKNLLEELTEESYTLSSIAATYLTDTTFPTFAKNLGVQPVHHNLLVNDFAQDKYDICIYLAGNSNHGTAVDDPVTDLSLNAYALLRFLQNLHVDRFIYLSSGAVYFGLKGFVTPQTLVNPIFSYGISKLASEHYVQFFYHLKRLSSCAVFRLFYAYGKYDKPRRLIPRVTRSLLIDNNKHFTVHGTGQSLMNPLDARYVACVLAQAALNSNTSGTFDLCGETGDQTVQDVVADIGTALGREIMVNCDLVPEAFPVEFYGSLDLTKSTFFLQSPEPLSAGVQRYVEWALDL